jgi:CDP-diacylglycerol---serine O-phosphatidyltransferase
MNRENKKSSSPRHLKRVAVLPSLVTLANALFGFAAIHFAARGMNEPHLLWLNKPELTFFAAAAWMIVLAMIADAMDGFVARRSGGTSDFGGQLDSLSDVISFGVAPAFLALRVVESGLKEAASPLFGSLAGKLLWLVAAMYVCCAALRLARFNVENNPDESSHLKFKGLPSPAAAGMIASLVLLYSDLVPELQKEMPAVAPVSSMILYTLPFVLAMVAILMVSTVPFTHVVSQYLKGRKPFGYVVLIVFLLLLIFWKPQLTLTITGVIYLASGLLPWLGQKWIKRKDQPSQPQEQSDDPCQRTPQ